MNCRYRLMIVLPVAAGLVGCTVPPPAAEETSTPQDEAPPVAATKSGEKDKNLPSVLERVAFRALKSRNLRTAASLYRRVLELEPKRRSAQVGLADTLVYLGEPENAASIYRAALRSDPGDTKTRGKLGRTLLSLNKPREALGLIGQSMTSRRNVAGLNNLGVAYLLMNQTRKSQQYFQRAHELQPENLSVRNNLAVSLALSGQSGGPARLLGQLAGNAPALNYVRRNVAVIGAIEKGRKVGNAKLALLAFGDEAFPFLVAAVDADAGMRAGTSRMADRRRGAPMKSGSSRGPKSVETGGVPAVRKGRQLAQNEVVAQSLGAPSPGTPATSQVSPPRQGAQRRDIKPASSEAPAKAGTAATPPPAMARKTAPRAMAGAPGFRVQFGAFRNQRNARAAGNRIRREVPDLIKRFVLTLAAQQDGGTLFRLQTEDALPRAQADALCAKLKARSIGCYVTPAPQG